MPFFFFFLIHEALIPIGFFFFLLSDSAPPQHCHLPSSSFQLGPPCTPISQFIVPGQHISS